MPTQRSAPLTHVPSLRIRPTAIAAAEPTDDLHYVPKDSRLLLESDPSRRTDVRFSSGKLSLAGHLYRPPNAGQNAKTPGIVLCGPISSVKEQTVPHYAERLAAAGYTCLTFDPRNFGESEGEPRWHYDPSEVIEDFAAGVSYLHTRADIDRDRVGIVGVCMGAATRCRLERVTSDSKPWWP